MLNVSRNVLFAAIAVSVLAGCQTATRECDNRKPNVTYNGKCCGIGDAPCREGKGGRQGNDKPDREPNTPTPQ